MYNCYIIKTPPQDFSAVLIVLVQLFAFFFYKHVKFFFINVVIYNI